MRKLLSVLFLLVMVASMILPQIAVADSSNKEDIYAFAVGVPVVVDNNIDVTYTGKTWKDGEGNNKYEYIARISQAPIYNDDGSKVDCSWHSSEDAYIIINNVYSVQVIGSYITTTYQGQSMSWNPIVMVDSKEYVAQGSPKVLAVDPINSNYQNNVLEWDYSVCVRRVRVIEGMIQETWIFDKDPKGTVWIKDNAQKSAGFTWAIQPYAYDALDNPLVINQYKQVMASEFAKAVYPVTIDPTEVYVTSASDGWIYPSGGTYASVQAATTGTVSDATSSFRICGQVLSGGLYNVYKGYLYFDTSAIPDSASITSANVSVYGSVDASTANYNIVATNGMPTYPHDPLAGGDFNKANYTGNGSSFNTSGFITTGYNNISLNASGISWIDKSGTTKLCFRSSKDISATAPTTSEYVVVYSYEQGAGFRPYLEVVYVGTGIPTVTTNPATYVTKTTAQLNGYLNADGGEADTVSFNVQPWYSAGWLDCIEFTINASYVDADLTNFPVLVTGSQLNTTDTDFWTTVNSSGSDILFTNSAGTKLNRELVSISTTNKTMECYVNVTAIDDTTDTKFYMYYNSANISLYNESNSTSTWDTNYVGVWHMNDNPNTSTIQDSTYLDYDMTKKGANEPLETTGNFDGDKAQLFDNTNDYVARTVANWQSGDSAGTVFAFYNTRNATLSRIFSSSDEGTTTSYITFQPQNSLVEIYQRNAADVQDRLRGNTTITLNTWHGSTWQSTDTMFIFTHDSINQSVNTITGANNGDWFADTTLRDNIVIGAHKSTTVTTVFNGSISEVRVSNVSRSLAWEDATYHSLNTSTLFAPVTDVFTSTTTQSKNTGELWSNSLSGLTAGYLYGYKAEAVNSYGTAWGHWVWFTTVAAAMGNVSNLAVYPSATTNELLWTKGNYSSHTLIRYKVGSYPTTTADGNYLALVDGNSYLHTGLTSGTTYYYSLWAEDAGNYSSTPGYATYFVTTLAGGNVSATPIPPPMPNTWFSGTNTSKLQTLPFYDILTDIGDAGQIPATTWWFMILQGAVLTSGLLIYSRSKNLFIACILVMVFTTVLSIMVLMPMWIVYAFAIASMGLSWKDLR